MPTDSAAPPDGALGSERPPSLPRSDPRARARSRGRRRWATEQVDGLADAMHTPVAPRGRRPRDRELLPRSVQGLHRLDGLVDRLVQVLDALVRRPSGNCAIDGAGLIHHEHIEDVPNVVEDEPDERQEGYADGHRNLRPEVDPHLQDVGYQVGHDAHHELRKDELLLRLQVIDGHMHRLRAVRSAQREALAEDAAERARHADA
mmetsp:Transcript_29750/g.84861  ORF Transcript_29750/g.84861 Transcript_29750/m.84861 type:complete len:204 (+) Transcript_29750:75-686(+)